MTLFVIYLFISGVGFPVTLGLLITKINKKENYNKRNDELRNYIGKQKVAIDVLKMHINDEEKVKKLFADHRVEL